MQTHKIPPFSLFHYRKQSTMKFSHILFLLISILQLLLCMVRANFDVEFGYSGSKGPDKWGSLDPKYALCSSGKKQSPVNIERAKVVKNNNSKPLDRTYEDQIHNSTLVNYGFSVSMQFGSKPGDMSVDGKNYSLLRFHWHTPSEHKIDGKQFPAELHMVHKAEDGSLAVLAILYEIGNKNDLVIEQLSKAFKEMKNDQCKEDDISAVTIDKFDPKYLKKSAKKFYRYTGSITTPPCTENISWNILAKVKLMTNDQLAAIQAPLLDGFKQNARPTQELNDRKIEMHRESPQS